MSCPPSSRPPEDGPRVTPGTRNGTATRFQLAKPRALLCSTVELNRTGISSMAQRHMGTHCPHVPTTPCAATPHLFSTCRPLLPLSPFSSFKGPSEVEGV